jgi:NAD(P)-dependent dehydrogenase (short-subunit alcohol dehydrogenase family)
MNGAIPSGVSHAGVVVTGAGTGIGLAVALDLVQAGIEVWGVGLDSPERHSGAPNEGDERFRFEHADVTDEDSVAEVASAIATAGTRVVGLVNCAGIYPGPADIEHTSLADWEKVLTANATSAFLMCRAVVPLLRQSGGGAIVNIGSVHAIAGAPGQPAYAASKAALVGLTRQLAVDYAKDGIRANCVLAGAVDTRITRRAIAESGGEVALGLSSDIRSLGRIAQPSEVAEVVSFLLSPSSSFITGAAITADGGMTARIL